MEAKNIIVAIDGHSGCGKSSTAKKLAKELGMKYIDSGAMYRAVTLYLIQKQIDFEDIEAVKAILSTLSIDFKTHPKTNENQTYLNGNNVEKQIRTMQITQHVSDVSRIAEIRHFLVGMQQKMGEKEGVVMDGRDIGTVVFPDADIKIFMTADLRTRALRRQKELAEKNQNVDLSTIKENLQNRDYLDSTRKESPLRMADGAHVIDTTKLEFEEQVAQIKQIVSEVWATNA